MKFIIDIWYVLHFKVSIYNRITLIWMLILQKSLYFCSWRILPICWSSPVRPPGVCLHQLKCYFLSPCLLLHQLLQLCSVLVLQHHCRNWEYSPPPKRERGRREEPDDPKPSADIQREHSYDYLYSPIVGAVKKIAVSTLVSIGIAG